MQKFTLIDLRIIKPTAKIHTFDLRTTEINATMQKLDLRTNEWNNLQKPIYKELRWMQQYTVHNDRFMNNCNECNSLCKNGFES